MSVIIDVTHKARDRLAQRIHKHLDNKIVAPFNIQLPNNNTYHFGKGDPKFTITVNNQKGVMALTKFDQLVFSESYINNSIDIEGDMWNVVSSRETLHGHHPLHTLWRRIAPFIKGQLFINKTAISSHYEYGNEFYLKFLLS